MPGTSEFRPDPAYATRCWINAILMWLLSCELWVAPLAVWLAVTESPAGGLALLIGPNVIFFVICALYIPAWVASIRYEMTDEEVVVHKGVFSKVHKIVPYRTVTNVSITRLWLDRIWLGIGNVSIQTAGAGASSVAEERLVGLSNYEEIRDAVVEHLRRYRADASPALGGGASGVREVAGGEEAPGGQEAPASSEAAGQMLEELRAIRRLLEKGA